MKKSATAIWVLGLGQAIGAGVVLWGWTWFMTNLDKFVNTADKPNATGFVLMPVTFVITAVLSAGAVLGYPIFLALNKNWSKALWLVGWTLIWLAVFAIVLIYLY